GLFCPDEDFFAFFFLSHGIGKLLLVVGLLRGKLWSYPKSLIVFGFFFAFQLYRFSYPPGAGLIGITCLDFFVVGLIWRRFRIMRRHLLTVRAGLSENPWNRLRTGNGSAKPKDS